MRTLLLAVLVLTSAADVLARNPELTDDSALGGAWVSGSDTLTFDQGRYILDAGTDGAVEYSGRYETVGNAMSLAEEGALSSCATGGTGFYRFYIVEGQLRLKQIEEPCDARKAAVDQAWKRR